MTTLAVGDAFADYVIDGVVARGGMGVVYRATQQHPRRRVALKLIAPERAADPAYRERFLREAELLASMEHPSIVPIHAAGEWQGELYLAMRYIDGPDLGSLLAREGPLSVMRTVRILRPLADALDAAHAQGLIHRDVKPGNILFDGRGAVYLTDFGLTKRTISDSQLTSSGQAVGSPGYMSPEQFMGLPGDPELAGRTDEYALGCVAFACLTGSEPYRRDTWEAAMWAHAYAPVPLATALRPELPAEVDTILARALAKDPAARYGSVTEFVEALAAVADQLGPEAAGRPAVAGVGGGREPGAVTPPPGDMTPRPPRPIPPAPTTRQRVDEVVQRPVPPTPSQPAAGAAPGPTDGETVAASGPGLVGAAGLAAGALGAVGAAGAAAGAGAAGAAGAAGPAGAAGAANAGRADSTTPSAPDAAAGIGAPGSAPGGSDGDTIAVPTPAWGGTPATPSPGAMPAPGATPPPAWGTAGQGAWGASPVGGGWGSGGARGVAATGGDDRRPDRTLRIVGITSLAAVVVVGALAAGGVLHIGPMPSGHVPASGSAEPTMSHDAGTPTAEPITPEPVTPEPVTPEPATPPPTFGSANQVTDLIAMIPADVDDDCASDPLFVDTQVAVVVCKVPQVELLQYERYRDVASLREEWARNLENFPKITAGKGDCSTGEESESSWNFKSDDDSIDRGRLLCAHTDDGTAVLMLTAEYGETWLLVQGGKDLKVLYDDWAAGNYTPLRLDA